MVKTSFVGGAVLAAAALIKPSLAAQSTFVAPSQSLAFAISIPSNPADDDIYFSLAFPTSRSWAAVGMGSHGMAGSLMLVAYPSATGKNVTLSPRLAYGHTEPEPYPGLEFTTLTNATGVANGSTYVYSAACHNCRSWGASGSINVSSAAQAMIFATGPASGGVRSDSADAPLRIHYEYGLFSMDMAQAQGTAGPAVLDLATTAQSDGATLLGQPTEGMMDWYVVVHGIAMILCFFIMMPIGVGLLRLGQWVRWHGVNQGIAVLMAIAGLVVAIPTSMYYNRSRHFDSGHQIIGVVVLAFAVAQFTLGYLHHRIFKKTRQTTKMAPVHVWLGRVTIPLGMFNGFLGFPLALDSIYDVGLAGLVLVVIACTVLARVWVARRRTRPAKVKVQASPGYVISKPIPIESWQMGTVGMAGSTSLR